MKKVLIALSLFISSCGHMNDDQSKKPSNPEVIPLDNTSETYHEQYKIYTLEGCEYVVVGCAGSRWGSHKGNCSNPIHKIIK